MITRNLMMMFALMVCFACGGTDGTNTGDTPNGVHGQTGNPTNSGGQGGSVNAGSGGVGGTGMGGSGGSVNDDGGLGDDASSSDDGGGNTGGNGGGAGSGGSAGSAGSGGSGGSTGDDGGVTDSGMSDDGSSDNHPDATVPPSDGGGNNQDSGCNDGGNECHITCTRTQGYYANHPNAWRYSSLTLGLTSYTEMQCLAFLASPTNGDASLILADQLISAMLNGACAASGVQRYPSEIALLMMESQSWMTQWCQNLPCNIATSSSEGQQAVELAASLDQFNNGALGFPHCQ